MTTPDEKFDAADGPLPWQVALETGVVILELKVMLDTDPGLKNLLKASLIKAKAQGETKLKSDLYNALQWPVTTDGYLDYLWWFARWTPHESTDPAWTAPGTDEQQEVYDHLCHFYWLIDQEVGSGKKIAQDNEWFGKWLVSYAKAWGDYLNTTQSFSPETLDSFINNSPKFAVGDSMIFDAKTPDGRPNAASGWLTFNQFFARELNPGLRPISSPMDNAVITSPADCTYRKTYAIDCDSKIEGIVTIKKTHQVASVVELLEGSPYGDAFANGKFVHYFLGPNSYHRFHAPVAGLLRECRAVTGLAYLDVKTRNGQFHAPDNSQGGYEFAQARGIVILDTSESACGDVGLVGIVPVGMCQVSSVNMTAMVGNNLRKGGEFGYFLFGGSDIILLFQDGVNPQIHKGNQYRHYGTTVATCGS